MMTDHGTLQEQFARLQARLELEAQRPISAVAPDRVADREADREALKQDIIALFRQAQVALAEAQAFKEAVRGLVEEWKSLDLAPSAAPAGGSIATASGPPAMHATRLDHLGAATFIEKGWTRLALEDYPGAEAALRKALELVPAQNEAESLLSWALMLQAQYADATQAAHAVLARDATCAVAHVCLGYVALRQERFDEAVRVLSHAIALDGDHKATLYAHLYLGMVHEQQGYAERAESCFGRTLELGPNCLQAWYERGRNHWRQGRTDDALHAWRAGSEANKFSPWGKRCAEVVSKVEQGQDPLGR